MTLPASGSISMSQVLAELQIAAPSRAYPVSLTDTDVRTLAGVPSGNISMSDLYGKSSALVVFGGTLGATFNCAQEYRSVGVVVYVDGSILSYVQSSDYDGIVIDGASNNGYWHQPIAGGVGDSYYVKCTRITGTALSSDNTWQALTSNRVFLYNVPGINNTFLGTFRLYISTAGTDGSIVATSGIFTLQIT